MQNTHYSPIKDFLKDLAAFAALGLFIAGVWALSIAFTAAPSV